MCRSRSAFSRFVPKETDRRVHLQDIIMACIPTAGDRCVTACTCLCPATQISVSQLHLVAFRGTPGADRSGNEAFLEMRGKGACAHSEAHMRQCTQKHMRAQPCQVQPRGMCHSHMQANE